MERATALEGTDGDDHVVGVGAAIRNGPEQRREEKRAVAVDDEDTRVRTVAKLLIKPKGRRHPTEAGSQDQDLAAPRGRRRASRTGAGSALNSAPWSVVERERQCRR